MKYYLQMKKGKNDEDCCKIKRLFKYWEFLHKLSLKELSKGIYFSKKKIEDARRKQ
jgi:hypothetical protein